MTFHIKKVTLSVLISKDRNICIPEIIAIRNKSLSTFKINKDVKEQTLLQNDQNEISNVAMQLLNHFKTDNTTRFST